MFSVSKHAVLGFLFGTIGIFALSSLSLVSHIFEVVLSPLFWPGRFMAATFVGASVSNTQVLLLTLFNGVLYAVIFALIGYAWRKFRAQ
jgi:hypothetical protein